MREFKLPIEIDLNFLRKSQEGVILFNKSDAMDYFPLYIRRVVFYTLRNRIQVEQPFDYPVRAVLEWLKNNPSERLTYN